MNHGGRNTELALRLQRLLEARLGSGTAISFALVQEGELIAAACAGTKDGDPARPAELGDLYGIGSLSKIYCTMAVLKLCEMGLADLDTPVCRWLPEFVMRDARYREITLRMCLNHSSGLPGLMFRNFLTDGFIDQETFYRDFFDYLSGAELKAPPGTNSVYSNDGFELAEAVVARLSGMSFTAFVQKYLNGPLGLTSTCSREKAPEGRAYIRMKGMPGECIMYVGAGGLYSDMSDCARFGWSFIEPGKAFTAGSALAAMTPQKLVYSEAEQGWDFGLGWDSVSFALPGAGPGGGILIKTGGSYSFSSYLVVSPAFRMSLAISATADSDSNTMGVLFEIVGELMAMAGVSGSGGAVPDAEAPEPPSLPEGYADRYSGVYYSDSAQFRVSFPGGLLRIEDRTAAGWEAPEADLPFNGFSFGTPGSDYTFSMNGKTAYLNSRLSAKFSAIAEKPAELPPANAVWAARNGKRYLLENASAHDLGAGGITASAAIGADAASGIVSVVTRGYLQPFSVMPAAASGDDTTKMFLTAPTMGSRNLYPFRVTVRDGAEHLSWCGYSFRDADSLPELNGPVRLEPGACLPYRIGKGVRFGEIPACAAVLLLNEELDVISDSRIAGPPAEAGAGFAIFLSSGTGTVELC